MIKLPFKAVGCLLIIAVGTAAGFLFSQKLYKRREFLKNFVEFISSLETNLRFNSDDVYLLVNTCAENCGIKTLFVDDNMHLSFEKAWNETVARTAKIFPLAKSDVSLMKSFGTQLGKTDVEGQLKHLELYKVYFQKQLSDAQEAVGQKSKLYRTMGFFAGSAAALMMI